MKVRELFHSLMQQACRWDLAAMKSSLKAVWWFVSLKKMPLFYFPHPQKMQYRQVASLEAVLQGPDPP